MSRRTGGPKRMAICSWCEQEMLEASSCSVEALHLDGVPIPLFRYGREPRYRSRPPARCGGSGVRAAGHPPPGCPPAECPPCAHHLLPGECRYDEDGDRPPACSNGTPDDR